MSAGCRDCIPCTQPGIVRLVKSLAMLFAVIGTIGLAKLPKVFLSTCPQCRHRQSRHRRRADGSFMD